MILVTLIFYKQNINTIDVNMNIYYQTNTLNSSVICIKMQLWLFTSQRCCLI